MKPTLILIVVMFAIQLAVPGYMIFEQNQILTKGTAYKFKTRPIDPYDPFRGRYVTLSYAADQEVVPVMEGAEIESEDWVYALVGVDDEGYAVLEVLTDIKPEDDQDYLYLETFYRSYDGGYLVSLPFDRYFSSEENAPKIESAVWRRQRDEVEDVYAKVRVYRGKGTIEELMVNDMPIKEYIESQQEKP